ncbi:N-acetylneuraminate synthase [Brochothrix thermosphacta]|uniref:N-acetylneuraminate synthase n=1 Tax=Brochothrix thermosphacta TaxID=2756 RepID=UPI00083FD8DE|nr:N-acetylneuraminate synthase [Brochothrix thermosphacta]ODJ51737.1 N-acetylneuraminate synthase [Brochothrix thermosphacta]ODJ63831.1 N-acetylneuraminate synthase [Brochothrix thermosphacta]ODJ66244.1 N-acetylneuraminate synthase [Brochothrix thermosphacta]WKK68387.1 N-acetylneuraminate synthase [Brochothrix thermosphacta]
MVYVIAEIGCNHNGDFNLAKKMVDVAISTGVDAVKFQTFKADKLISKYAPKAEYQKRTTDSEESQLDMTRKLELGFDEYLKLKKYCEDKNVDVFSTPFDDESLEFLISTDMAIYKIPSGEVTNLPYLQKIGSLNKRVIISTGMATMREIHDAVNILKEAGTEDITILHCTTEYPTQYSDLNLNVIHTLKKEFPNESIGYSDHSIGYEVPIAATAMGATVVEKHFTLDQNMPGPDHKASATPDVLEKLVKGIRVIETALGSYEKRVLPIEEKNKVVARKSIVANEDIKKGDVFTEKNLTVKRPGNGISPMCWYDVLGQKSEKDFKKDQLIQVEE